MLYTMLYTRVVLQSNFFSDKLFLLICLYRHINIYFDMKKSSLEAS